MGARSSGRYRRTDMPVVRWNIQRRSRHVGTVCWAHAAEPGSRPVGSQCVRGHSRHAERRSALAQPLARPNCRSRAVRDTRFRAERALRARVVFVFFDESASVRCNVRRAALPSSGRLTVPRSVSTSSSRSPIKVMCSRSFPDDVPGEPGTVRGESDPVPG